jgi:hypothetical protein
VFFTADTCGDYDFCYLEAAPTDSANAHWGLVGIDVAGTQTAIGSGKRNTRIVVEALAAIPETGKAAQICDNLVTGGKDDWFLPSIDELFLMYENLHAEGLGNFKASPALPNYYSSSQHNSSAAKSVDYYSNGTKETTTKENDSAVSTARVRAIRQF